MRASLNVPFSLTLALVAWTTSVLNGNAQVKELIDNGGFEIGEFAGWSAPSPNPNPWYMTATNHHGGQFAAMCPDLGYAVGQTTLFQSITPALVEDITSAGYWYYISRPSPGGNPAFATRLVFSDGTSVQDSLLISDAEYRLNEWAYRDWIPTLEANAGKFLVQVGFFPQYTDIHYVDDVSVIGIPTVPEPAAPALWGLLTLVLMITRRHR